MAAPGSELVTRMFEVGTDHLAWRLGHETLRVEPWGPDGIRVRAAVGGPVGDPLAGVGALLEREVPTATEIYATAAGAIVRNGGITAEVDAAGRLTFRRTTDGAELLAEEARHFTSANGRRFDAGPGELSRIEAAFRAYDGERLYGLGQQQHGRLDLKGCVIDLVQVNTHVVVPFLVSSRGYGFLWHNPAVGRVELAANGTRWVADAAPQVDYWVTAAPDPAGLLERYTAVTGRAPAFPAWASGFWQSKLRYRTQDELLSIAREHRDRGLPLSVLVIDGGHWTVMGEWRFDPADWPDPAAMMAELRELGVEVVVSAWPTVNALSRELPDLRDRGLLVRTARGIEATTTLFDTRPPGILHLFLMDATNPEARATLWDRLEDGYHRYGIRVFWLDADEPEIKPLHPDNLRYALGPGSAVHNLYPLLHSRAIHDGLRTSGETEILSLNRSAWAGSQRYGAALWSGDVDATFEALRAQVPAGLNAGLSGIPWWTTDTGGFKGGDPDDPAYREVLIRWAQLSAFCPIFRFHGIRATSTDTNDIRDLADLAERPASDDEVPFVLAGFSGGPNEVWSYGEEAYAILRELLALRERLRPTIHALMLEASERGIPPMRPLFLEFPADEPSWSVDDQFMLGPWILVAPVMVAGARERSVYLPAGATWRDGWTGEPYEAGRRHVVAAPLDRIPVFLRDDAQVPLVGE
jgi:alpha-D-xyloside xylohydrolase